MDFGDGYKLLEAPITVTLVSKADGSSTVVPFCLKRAADLSDFANEPAIMEEETCAFHLWVDNLSGKVPNKGDTIIDDQGASWHVVVRATQNHSRKFRLACFKERTP